MDENKDFFEEAPQGETLPLSKINEKIGGGAFSAAIIVSLIVEFIVSVIFAFFPGVYEEMPVWYIYIAYSISPVSLFLVLWFFGARFKLNLKDFGINKCKPKYFGVAFLLFFGAFFGLSYVNEYFVLFLRELGFEVSGVSPPLDTPFQFLLSILIVGVMSPFLEELLFRGLILRGSEKIGEIQAILLNGLLFSLFHQNPAQTMYQFIIGCVFALIAIKSCSIWPSVLIHFINNFVVLIILYFYPEAPIYNEITVFLGLNAFVVGIIILFMDREKEGKKGGKTSEFLLYALLGILVCVMMWIISLVL